MKETQFEDEFKFNQHNLHNWQAYDGCRVYYDYKSYDPCRSCMEGWFFVDTERTLYICKDMSANSSYHKEIYKYFEEEGPGCGVADLVLLPELKPRIGQSSEREDDECFTLVKKDGSATSESLGTLMGAVETNILKLISKDRGYSEVKN